jgi:hypothetical protein
MPYNIGILLFRIKKLIKNVSQSDLSNKIDNACDDYKLKLCDNEYKYVKNNINHNLKFEIFNISLMNISSIEAIIIMAKSFFSVISISNEDIPKIIINAETKNIFKTARLNVDTTPHTLCMIIKYFTIHPEVIVTIHKCNNYDEAMGLSVPQKPSFEFSLFSPSEIKEKEIEAPINVLKPIIIII